MQLVRLKRCGEDRFNWIQLGPHISLTRLACIVIDKEMQLLQLTRNIENKAYSKP